LFQRATSNIESEFPFFYQHTAGLEPISFSTSAQRAILSQTSLFSSAQRAILSQNSLFSTRDGGERATSNIESERTAVARQRCRLDGGGAQRDRGQAKPSQAKPSQAKPSRAIYIYALSPSSFLQMDFSRTWSPLTKPLIPNAKCTKNSWAERAT